MSLVATLIGLDSLGYNMHPQRIIGFNFFNIFRILRRAWQLHRAVWPA